MTTPFQNMHDGDMNLINEDDNKGLYGKYIIERADGKSMKPGFRFILSPECDLVALEALKTYQKETNNKELATDLKNAIIEIESKNQNKKRGIEMTTNTTDYKKGDVLLLTGRGIVNRERMIIRKGNEYFPLDAYTGNVVDIFTNFEKFNTAEEIVNAYQKKGYTVEVKPKN